VATAIEGHPRSLDAKRLRQREILDIVAGAPVGSQEQLVAQLRDRGLEVTQATVSRDVAELGLAKIARGGRHVYVTAAAIPAAPHDDRLRRIVSDIPIRIGRSGLTLVLTALPGTASVIAQAIDQSDLREQEGTLAGDNTLLVLFRDEQLLERWLARFRALQGAVASDPAIAVDPRRTMGRGAPDTHAADTEARA
jgi:transcriptional regulator of arginine metabolism